MSGLNPVLVVRPDIRPQHSDVSRKACCNGRDISIKNSTLDFVDKPERAYFSTSGIGDFVRSVNTDGAPDKNHTAMKASKIMHPNEDVGMKGQIGLPHKW
jgi:hypothetical protein